VLPENDGAVQFASVSEPGSGKARKRVEQPRRMAVAGKETFESRVQELLSLSNAQEFME